LERPGVLSEPGKGGDAGGACWRASRRASQFWGLRKEAHSWVAEAPVRCFEAVRLFHSLAAGFTLTQSSAMALLKEPEAANECLVAPARGPLDRDDKKLAAHVIAIHATGDGTMATVFEGESPLSLLTSTYHECPQNSPESSMDRRGL